MGNSPLSNNQLFASYTKSKYQGLSEKENPFIVKQFLAQSPEHHHQLITKIAKLKQYQCDNIVKIIDSHTVQTHNLCSIISHIYILMQKPTYHLKEYAEKLNKEGVSFQNQQIVAILMGCAKALQYLGNEGQEYMLIDETVIFVNDNGNGQISLKLMNPLFTDFHIEKQQLNTIQQQIAHIILSLKASISQDLANLILLLRDGRITLKEVAERLTDGQRKTKNGLQLMKHISKEQARESINSLASNGESLMINGGDVSQEMLKDFYEHFDNSISFITMRSLDGYTLNESIIDQQTSHRFPRKYLKSKAFKKVINRETGREWSEKGSQKHNITRDQSIKDNFRIQSKTVLLSSAKLVQSFISELHHQ